MDRCVNCGIATSRCNTLGGRSLDNETTLAVIRQWRAPHPVNSSDHVCQACWDLAQQPSVDKQRQLGHHNVCLRCGRSLASRVSHLLNTGSARELRIYNVIQERIMPRNVEEASRICHKCWVAADRAAIHMVTGPSTSFQGCSLEDVQPQVQDLPTETSNEEFGNKQTEPTIVLPDYMRAIETERRCFIKGCQKSERYRVPLSTRKMLLSQYKYYIPENNRLCDRHLVIEAGDILDSLRTNYVQTFTAKHIQDMMSLK
ncbi:unnamed protein product [Parnassius mnemosyne]|uniref:Uncharacterized protein n=1 Tax=Parnassius mnemosyne TaxID=213953 RepID=A0AAV1LM19_9NEOP